MAVSKAIRKKIARVKAGNPPRFMDLFAGCGGISLGFATAGFELIASVEFDPWAAESHGANFAGVSHGTNQQAHFKARDITKEDPVSIFRDLGIGGEEEDRTPDLRIANATLSQLSYRPSRRAILAPSGKPATWHPNCACPFTPSDGTDSAVRGRPLQRRRARADAPATAGETTAGVTHEHGP